MVNTILDSVKKMLGVPDESFDDELVMFINGVLAEADQLCDVNIKMIDKDTLVSELSDNEPLCNMLLVYINMKVKSVFDPPTSSMAATSMTSILKEYAFRLTSFEKGGD